MVHFTLYARAYCHLCADMVQALAALQPAHRFTFDVVDVDADPRLVELYDELVPVLVHQGREVCHYHLDAVATLAIVDRFAEAVDPVSANPGSKSNNAPGGAAVC